MDEKKLKKLINDLVLLPSENEVVEFKENNFNKEDIGKRISALANSSNLYEQKNAYLVFGINDYNHDIVGTKFKPKNKKIGSELLEFWLSKHVNPKHDFRIYECQYNGKDIVIFQIPPAISQPIKFNNIAYIRIDSVTTKLSEHPEKERKIWNNINRNSFEKGIAMEGLSVANVLELLDYSKYFSLMKQTVPSDTKQFVEKMSQHGLVKKIFDDRYDITNLGAILFAKNLNDFSTVKRKKVRVVLYVGNNKVDRLKEHEFPSGYIFTSRLNDFVISSL